VAWYGYDKPAFGGEDTVGFGERSDRVRQVLDDVEKA
jgi:hypothetical protein